MKAWNTEIGSGNQSMIFYDRFEEKRTGRLEDRLFNCKIMFVRCFLSTVGTEDIRMNLEPSVRHVMVISTLMTFNAMKNI